jgi:hypothetical protein
MGRAAKSNPHAWLLLLFRFSASHKTERVALWRRFKKIGALQITTSTYLLPDRPAQDEHFQWLAKQIRDGGGDATLVRAREIEGLPNKKLVELFNQARDAEYTALSKPLRALVRRKGSKENLSGAIGRLKGRFREIGEIDFFDSAQAQDVEMLLRKIEQRGEAKGAFAQVSPKNYRGKIWLTRPRPEIDRVGSAWLIRNFIDPKARFVFGKSSSARSKAVSFDMLKADFSHQGDDCTFETLARRFRIQDKAVRQIGEMIHDADLDDAKFERHECLGIDRMLKGWAKQGMSDNEILIRGFQCFDGLYSFLRRL